MLLPYDLTRGGSLFDFYGHTDVKELGLYAEDQIKTGNWLFNVGLRFDRYNGLAKANQIEPRLGVSYSIKKTGTVLRTSYASARWSLHSTKIWCCRARAVEAMYWRRCCSVLRASRPHCSRVFVTSFTLDCSNRLRSTWSLSGDYIWKYTHNAFDFAVLGNTPITFPIDWHNSKIPGFDLRVDVPTVHNFSAFVVMSSVKARFFPPQVAGAGATVAQGGVYPFRIDHDEKFNQTTHGQYTIPAKHAPWIGFNWRYDSGTYRRFGAMLQRLRIRTANAAK